MNSPLRVVLVGCGGMSAEWIRTAQAHPDLQIVGLVDLSEEMARARAGKFGLTDVVIGTDLAGALDRTRPDAVFDCTVPGAHSVVTRTALAAGCHVLGEKPMAVSLDEARTMLAAARAAGKLYAVMQNRRYAHGVRRLGAFLDGGELGRITTVHADFLMAAHFGGFRDEMAHVLLTDMAIHTFDQARFFLGGARARAVICHEWNPPGSWYRQGASAVATFEMTGDAVFSYRGSWCAEGLATSWQSAWRIIGERGTVRWDGEDDFRAEVVAGEDGFMRATREVTVPNGEWVEKADGHASVIAEFAAAIRSGAQPETVGEENFGSLAMVHAAIASAERGERVLVPES